MALRTPPANNQDGNSVLPVLCAGSRRDLPALLHIEKICFIGGYAPHRFCSSDFSIYIARPHALFQIAMANGEPVGYVAGMVRRKRGDVTVRLDGIAVLPGWRRRGVGRQLLDWFLKEAPRRRANRVMLEVLASNATGVRWFIRAGFNQVRNLPNYYATGVDGIEMSRDLTGRSARVVGA